MEINITSTEEEKIAVMNAIEQLNNIQHMKSMSNTSLAECANIKSTKVRVVLADLVAEELITKYIITENKSIQRYYYVVSIKGKEILLNGFPK